MKKVNFRKKVAADEVDFSKKLGEKIFRIPKNRLHYYTLFPYIIIIACEQLRKENFNTNELLALISA